MPVFPAWRPDAYSLMTGVARDVSGVLPGAGGWTPWPAMEEVSAVIGDTVRGAFVARDNDGSFTVFVGTEDKLLRYAGIASAWEDVSRTGDPYDLPQDYSWSFDQFGNRVIACNGVDAPQSYLLGASTRFADLAGSPPIARYVKTVGDHVWLISLSATLGPSGIPGGAQIQWSGFRDPEWWGLNEKSSDFFAFPSGGNVQGCTSELSGLIFLERAIWRFAKDQMKVFDTAPIQKDQGTMAPYSIVQDEGDAYFYGTKGFAAIGANGAAQIGDEWVNNWFLENVNQQRFRVIIGALDPVKKRVYWAYPGKTNAEGYQRDGVICFDMANKERPWTKADIQSEYIVSAATPGATLADLTLLYSTLAGVPYPLGSDVWRGGAPRLAAFTGNNKLAFFTGTNMAARVETNDFMPVPGRRFYINGFRLVSDTPVAQGRVHVKERPQDGFAAATPGALTAQGFIPQRASGRIMKQEVTVPAATEWSFIAATDHMDGDIRPMGGR